MRPPNRQSIAKAGPRAMLTLVTAFVLIAAPVRAERAKSPADATVFIRLVGSVHVDIVEAGLPRTIDLDRVEIGTGSGFVVSSDGYVLTNEHVINSDPLIITKGVQQAKVTMKVSRIEVCFPQAAITTAGRVVPCSAASVSAVDASLDLALLYVGGTNLPYVARGASDAIAAGVAVDALGYPYGQDVEVGRIATAPDLVPEVSIVPGAVSAIRADDAGNRRYLQVTNGVNPGNSGGPIVDRDGFAVGVIRMRLTKAEGIGFAIPINDVKDFFQARGFDQLMPTRRLRLGAFHNLDVKGLGLRLPEGVADTSPFRSRVEADAPATEIALRIDRVLSSWSGRQIEEALTKTRTFEPFSMTAREMRVARSPGDRATIAGGAVAIVSNVAQEIRLDYAVVDVGSEKLVARYVGPIESMAFNESVLRESLLTLQGRRLLVDAIVPVEQVQWETYGSASGQRMVPMPAGWLVAPGGQPSCARVPGVLTAVVSPDDFTLSVRSGIWADGNASPEAASASCSSSRGTLGAASYTSRAEWLGETYMVEGIFARTGTGQLLQLEVIATARRNPYARALLAAWLKKATE